MLNVGQLNEGFVLDHIEAGKAMDIYNNLGLGKLDCQVAIIKNARSSKMGRKDIITKEYMEDTEVFPCNASRKIWFTIHWSMHRRCRKQRLLIKRRG